MTMDCPVKECDGTMATTHSYPAGPGAVCRAVKCRKCGFISTTVTFLLEMPKRKKRGHGAIAVARKVEEGVLVLKSNEP